MNASLRTLYADVRAEADALIEQATRIERGFDRGLWRDDVRLVERQAWNTIAAARRARVWYAMKCCKLIHAMRSA